MTLIRTLAVAALLAAALAGCKHLYAAGDVGGHYASPPAAAR